MSEVTKKLGRPKVKAKAKDAEWLFGERLSAEDKRKLEEIRLSYRCQLYDVKKHGAMPTALPKVSNKLLLHYLVTDSYYLLFVSDMPQGSYAGILQEKGCLNIDELLPEGQGE